MWERKNGAAAVLLIHPDLFVRTDFRVFCSRYNLPSCAGSFSFAVYCSANVSAKNYRLSLILTRPGTSIYFRVANHPVKSPTKIKSTQARHPNKNGEGLLLQLKSAADFSEGCRMDPLLVRHTDRRR